MPRAFLIAALTTACAEEAGVWVGEGGLARLEPALGAYFGANLDLGSDSMGAFNDRLGHDAAVFVQFVDFPMDEGDRGRMASFFQQVARNGAIAVATFEPTIPLWEIDQAMADDLAGFLGSFNDEYGLDILVRFAHEMNGSWYSWSQQPIECRGVWRRIADAVHEGAWRTGMLWAPSYAGGYPFRGGAYEARPGSEDFELLDTDGDGVLTMWDDAYGPYYPGDAWVDWVGVSLYHWGADHPWGDNEVPEPHKFIDLLTGDYAGTAGDETGLTDFYATFTEGHGKPMAIVETAALYNPGRGGDDELAIKQAWWRQVFADEVFERFPRLRMINWFEWDKLESEIDWERIDWTVTRDERVRGPFLQEFPAERFVFAPVHPQG